MYTFRQELPSVYWFLGPSSCLPTPLWQPRVRRQPASKRSESRCNPKPSSYLFQDPAIKPSYIPATQYTEATFAPRLALWTQQTAPALPAHPKTRSCSPWHGLRRIEIDAVVQSSTVEHERNCQGPSPSKIKVLRSNYRATIQPVAA